MIHVAKMRNVVEKPKHCTSFRSESYQLFCAHMDSDTADASYSSQNHSLEGDAFS